MCGIFSATPQSLNRPTASVRQVMMKKKKKKPSSVSTFAERGSWVQIPSGARIFFRVQNLMQKLIMLFIISLC